MPGRTQRSIQKEAFLAMISMSADRFCRSVGDGVRLDRTKENKVRKRFVKGNLNTYTLIECAVFYAMSLDDCEILKNIESRGIDIQPAINNVIQKQDIPKITTKSKRGVFLDCLLRKWPNQLGDPQDLFNLHKLSAKNYQEYIQVLLKHGLHVDCRDDKGRTPLMNARQSLTVKAFQTAGANLKAVDNKGKSVIWHITQRLVKEIMRGDGKLYRIAYDDADALGEVFRATTLLDDPQAIHVARKLHKQLNSETKTAQVMFGASKSTAIITQEVSRVLARQKMKDLSHIMNTGKDKPGSFYKNRAPVILM